MTHTSRSQVETYTKCPRLRYWEYEVEGRGLDLDGSATALNIGSCVHAGIEAMVRRLDLIHPGLLMVGLQAATAAPQFDLLTFEDDRDLVTALVRTWWFAALPATAGWEVVDVEREEVFDYVTPNPLLGPHPMNLETVRFQSRSDLIARAAQDAYLGNVAVAPGLYNWNWKTIRSLNPRHCASGVCGRCIGCKRKELAYDAQTFTELLGPEARMGETFAGVVYLFLIKEDHPLLWCWRHVETGEVAHRYRWTCETAHENTHAKKGGWCPGGKNHMLGGFYERVAVRDLPGGQEAAFERLQADDPALLHEFCHIIGPMQRPPDHMMEEWCESNLPREAALAALRSPEVLDESLLRRHFPKHTARKNCTLFYDCPAMGLCWHGRRAEDYEYRVPNHPEVDA